MIWMLMVILNPTKIKALKKIGINLIRKQNKMALCRFKK
jgi:hypothetical protein